VCTACLAMVVGVVQLFSEKICRVVSTEYCHVCIIMLVGCPQKHIARFQRVHHALHLLELSCSSPLVFSFYILLDLLEQLHWLPIQWRIRFKLASSTYKAMSPNSITPTLRQSPVQVPDKVANVSRTQIMKVRDTNHVADFHDLCRGLS